MSVQEELDKVQLKLHDSGALWPRSELLDWFNDGYLQLIAMSQAIQRLLILDVPGRQTFSIVYDWEERHANGTYWQPFQAAGDFVCTYLWEIEDQGDISPSASLDGITYQWERAYSDETDSHYQFGLPKNHDRIVRLAYDDKLLLPVETRELDHGESRWMKSVGRPDWWTTGIGRTDSIEIYQIVVDYIENYILLGYEQGLPRQISGDRTYSIDQLERIGNSFAYTHSGDVNHAETKQILTGFGWRFTQKSDSFYVTQIWEKEMRDGETEFSAGEAAVTYHWETVHAGIDELDFSLGTIREMTSPDRQYVPAMTESGQYGLVGSIREWKSSEDALLFHQVVIPTVKLTEADTPGLIPAQLVKYCRFYTLSRALGRSGEGQNLTMAQIYDAKFQRGVGLFKRLGNVAFKDMVYVRQSAGARDERPPRVRLPAEFQRMW